MNSCIYNGEVTHTRFKPVKHFLKYKTFSILIDLDEINQLDKSIGIFSHNKFNIKLFVINNGGYVSMHNWADTFFRGRRVDNPIDTGDGTLNLKNIAKAFDMDYFLIPNSKNLDFKLKKINNIKRPLFIEVLTDNKQIIYDAYKDY